MRRWSRDHKNQHSWQPARQASSRGAGDIWRVVRETRELSLLLHRLLAAFQRFDSCTRSAFPSLWAGAFVVSPAAVACRPPAWLSSPTQAGQGSRGPLLGSPPGDGNAPGNLSKDCCASRRRRPPPPLVLSPCLASHPPLSVMLGKSGASTTSKDTKSQDQAAWMSLARNWLLASSVATGIATSCRSGSLPRTHRS